MTAQLIPEKDAESKAERHPYFPFYGDDWTGGTVAFTLEQEGFYLRFVKCQWGRQDDVPNDVQWLSAALRCDPRVVRRMLRFLIGAGKIEIAPDGRLFNSRMRKEIAKHQAKIDQRSGTSPAEVRRRSAGSTPKRPMKSVAASDQYLPPEPEPKPERKKGRGLSNEEGSSLEGDLPPDDLPPRGFRVLPGGRRDAA